MAFLTPRAGQSVLRGRNFQLKLIPAIHHGSPPQQHRPFSQAQQQAIKTKQVQIYHSTSSDPYINLSIEHHLLQHSHPDSTVLFLYTNRPCVVIGRNQNPWLEINLQDIKKGVKDLPQKVDIVRRRSGGGTVFHDKGNTNWSVICSPRNFDRDKHAEMVVRALERVPDSRRMMGGVPRVNERHDIVLDVVGSKKGEIKTYKISGSAYKLTRQRSLHHGTCLLSSPFLDSISSILRSPATSYIKARGVDSVRSPVRNALLQCNHFEAAVVHEFEDMYGHGLCENDKYVDEKSALDVPDIKKGVEELKSHEWIYGQTPLFTFSTHPTEDDARPRPQPSSPLPENLQVTFSARHGQIQTAQIKGLYTNTNSDNNNLDELVSNELLKHKLHDITNWEDILLQPVQQATGTAQDQTATTQARNVARWLGSMFPPLK